MMMKSANIKAKEKYPFLDGVIQKNLEELAKLEEAREKDIDRLQTPLLNCWQRYLLLILLDKKEVLHELGYQLGRWIYLADAWEDRIEDRQKKRYNIFIEKFDQTENEAKESAEFNLKSAVNNRYTYRHMTYWSYKKNREILDNIMYHGMIKKTEAILQGEKENKRYGSV